MSENSEKRVKIDGKMDVNLRDEVEREHGEVKPGDVVRAKIGGDNDPAA